MLKSRCASRGLCSSKLCTTEFATARVVEPEPLVEPAAGSSPLPVSTHTPAVRYGPPKFARPSFTGGFPGSAFSLQPDGTLRCPADHPLYPQERRLERNGSPRVLYAAHISHCRSWTAAVRSVKKAAPRSNPDECVRCCGPSKLPSRIPRFLVKRHPHRFFVLRCCGKTGHAVASGAPGSK